MATGTVSQWIFSVQSLGLKKPSSVWELAEVFCCFFFRKFLTFSISQVPVVLIFTKFEVFKDKCYSVLQAQGRGHQEAKNEAPELANEIFQNEYLSRIQNTEFPPKTYVCLEGNIIFFIQSLNSYK